MGRLFLVCRLAARDLRHRPGEAVMLLAVITAATTALTLGLVLHGVTSSALPEHPGGNGRSGRPGHRVSRGRRAAR